MAELPDRERQIIAVHADFINEVVSACAQASRRPGLEHTLELCAEHGAPGLALAIRRILDGRRDPGILEGLDPDEIVVVGCVLRGLDNPETLPAPGAAADPTAAAPGLAGMIQAAASGNVEALQAVSAMAEQMSQVGGDMAKLAAVIRPMVNGERDADLLTRRMGPRGRSLVMAILDELSRLAVH